MFLVILLFIVLLSISFKEGLEAEQRVGEIYGNYDKIESSLGLYSEKFQALLGKKK